MELIKTSLTTPQREQQSLRRAERDSRILDSPELRRTPPQGTSQRAPPIPFNLFAGSPGTNRANIAAAQARLAAAPLPARRGRGRPRGGSSLSIPRAQIEEPFGQLIPIPNRPPPPPPLPFRISPEADPPPPPRVMPLRPPPVPRPPRQPPAPHPEDIRSGGRRTLYLAARQPYSERQALTWRVDFGTMGIKCPHCKAWHWKAEHLTSGETKFGKCCLQGKITLATREDPPPELMRLWTSDDDLSKKFRGDIRRYNSMFALASTGAELQTPDSTLQPHHGNVPGSGPWVYRLQGQLYHKLGPMEPGDGHARTYAQLLVLDPAEADRQRLAHTANRGLDAVTVHTLNTMLHSYNPYFASFKAAYEKLLEQERERPNHSLLYARLQFRAAGNTVYDPRTYRAPTADEIAILIPDGAAQQGPTRDIQVYLRGGGLRRLSNLDRAYHALSYPLLFPRGEDGFSLEIPLAGAPLIPSRRSDVDEAQFNEDEEAGEERQMARTGKVTQQKYYAYRLHPRDGDSKALFYGGKLLQQYIVDAYAAVRSNRLHWLSLNQDKLRADQYGGLRDALMREDNVGLISPEQIGRRFILPSSFPGSPRYMFQAYQDGMAVTRHYQKISLFVTMTANPLWDEIVRELLPEQRAEDRPDLIARVFAMKKKELIRMIFQDGVFGRAVAYVWTVEFQKRGLPHVHILVFLRNDYNPYSPEEVDAMVRAWLPDEQSEPLLHAIVLKHMIHGPCGSRNPDAPCMDKESKMCTKRYPRPLVEHTSMGVDSYPTYRRPDDGRTVQHKGVPINNGDVVPYNPFLSLVFDCHINVELCAGIRTMKYIHKYITKGLDRACAHLYQENELAAFVDAEYISASQATMRLFHETIHQILPNVVRLALHLEDQQSVIFRVDAGPEQLLNLGNRNSTLTAYFEANRSIPTASEYLYHEFPEHFVWDKSGGKWKLRQKGLAIGRIYFAPPGCGDRFYLRLLLGSVRGATSFTHLRTVNDVVHPTFQAACLALGLLEDDGEWIDCLAQAATWKSGTALRHLFVMILSECAPSEPDALWHQFKANICDDLLHRLRTQFQDVVPNPTDNDAHDYGLFLIQDALHQKGKELVPPMPLPQQNWAARDGANRLIREQRRYNIDNEQSKYEINAGEIMSFLKIGP